MSAPYGSAAKKFLKSLDDEMLHKKKMRCYLFRTASALNETDASFLIEFCSDFRIKRSFNAWRDFIVQSIFGDRNNSF